MIRSSELKQMHSDKIRNDIMSIRKSGQEFKRRNELHAAVPITTVAMLPIKKLALLKTGAPCSKGIHTTEKPISLSIMKAEVYQERKRKLPEYKDLFAALLRLPDKEMQRKIFDVINNHKPLEQRSVETQTDFMDESPNTIKNENFNIGDIITTYNTVAKGEGTLSNDCETNQTNDSEETLITELPKKRKRKRKVSLPQANKESRTKQLVKMNKPKATAINSNNLSLPYGATELQINGSKRARFDSSISECGSDVANICEDVETNPFSEVQAADITLENGLLPIQDAVVKNQFKKLCIHIIIWKGIRKMDLNDLVTDEDEDLLQLAILNCCDPTIVQLILNQGLNPNCLDAESNTIIHLAILNDVDVRSMEHLMKHIDLKLLLTLNDEGYTPLHLAIRQDRFLLAERLINVLDERLTNKIFYKLDYDELETDEMLLKKQFKNYYEKMCLQMVADEESSDLSVPNNHDLKQQLLQTGDRRSGNIALYFAIDNKFEHLIYFLLAHLTDPRSENLSGQDCKSFFSEYGKSLNLSLNIDNTMEKVITILS